jgi:hypothetical protein
MKISKILSKLLVYGILPYGMGWFVIFILSLLGELGKPFVPFFSIFGIFCIWLVGLLLIFLLVIISVECFGINTNKLMEKINGKKYEIL